MHNFNIYSRRVFLDRSFKTGLAVALATLTDIPFVMKRALAEGSIGQPGPDGKIKKVLFIWLRFGNDGLNTVIPIQDSEYALIRPDIGIQKDPIATDTLRSDYDEHYYAGTGQCFDATQFLDATLAPRTAANAVYSYNRAIRLGNGFAALHPSLKFLAPVYNGGDLAVMHRVAYPKQSRSHFDSQNYWENGNPNNNLSKDGIFYRTIIESGLANTAPLTGISIQSALPLILRGSKAAMTNLTNPTRYDLLGVPNAAATGDLKAFDALAGANYYPFPEKRGRELLDLQYENMTNTLRIFSNIDFSEAGNTFRDNVKTDGDTTWYPGASNDSQGYYLFPTTDAKNGGYQRPGVPPTNNNNKRVVPTSAYNSSGTGFINNLKAAAMILNKTDAVIAGTELGGFDTHQTQGGATGSHANLLQSVGWSMYALRKYFQNYADKATWENVVVVTLSEFGRTSVENNDNGTDHAEAGTMFMCGGAVNSGVFGCSDAGSLPWKIGPRDTVLANCGTMYAANPTVKAGYLRRSIDYRSVLGEVIRKHLGATQPQLNRIIPGYANAGECLLNSGQSSIDGVDVHGELGLL